MLTALITAVVLLALAARVLRRTRERALARVRAGWGQPVARERRMDAMAQSHRARVSHVGGTSLDERTWTDLNLDDVFAAIDRTESTLGQHALYHRLRTVPVADHLDAFESLVNRLGTDAALRERAQIALAPLQDPHGYDLWWLARPEAIDVRPWYSLFPVLAVVTMAMVVLAPFWPPLRPVLVAAFVVNLAVRYLTDFHIIGAAARAFRQLAPVIAAGQSLQFLEGDDVQPLVGAFRSDGPSLGRLKTIARWVGGNPLMLPMHSGPFAMLANDVVSTVYEYLNLLFHLDANGLYFGASELRARAPALLRLVTAIGEVDSAIGVASLRAGRSDWTRPSFHARGTPARLTDVRHPLVQDAVPNTVTLRPGQGLLITGSNMSGKSTLLRTIGVTTVMAQTVNTCLARAYDAPVFYVRSCIGRADDLLTGRSYYIVEVQSLLELVEASTGTSSCLFLLDELFRGTNAVERIAAGQAVLRELVVAANRLKSHVVIAATHDGELVDLLSDTYAAHHFGDAVAADGLVFDYRLKAGRATTRNAIALLRLHGAPETLVKEALTCAAELDRQRGGTVVGR